MDRRGNEGEAASGAFCKRNLKCRACKLTEEGILKSAPIRNGFFTSQKVIKQDKRNACGLTKPEYPRKIDRR